MYYLMPSNGMPNFRSIAAKVFEKIKWNLFHGLPNRSQNWRLLDAFPRWDSEITTAAELRGILCSNDRRYIRTPISYHYWDDRFCIERLLSKNAETGNFKGGPREHYREVIRTCSEANVANIVTIREVYLDFPIIVLINHKINQLIDYNGILDADKEPTVADLIRVRLESGG